MKLAAALVVTALALSVAGCSTGSRSKLPVAAVAAGSTSAVTTAATSAGAAASNTGTPGSSSTAPPANEVDRWPSHPEWIWVDDFEGTDPVAGRYHEFDDDGLVISTQRVGPVR